MSGLLVMLLLACAMATPMPASASASALEMLRDDVARYPGDVHLRAALAETELRSGDPAAAVDHYEQIATTSPTLATRYASSLGIAYQRAGRNEAAMRTLATVVAADDAPIRPRIHFALALEESGRGEVARAHWASIEQDEPDLIAEVSLLRGLSAQRRGQSDAAREHLRRAIENDYDGWVTIQAERALARKRSKAVAGPHLEVQAGLEFDSNVTQESSDKLAGAPSDSRDGRGTIGVDFAWRGIEIPQLDDLTVEAGYAGRQTLHFQLGELNRQLHAPYVGAAWQITKRDVFRISTLYSFELLGSDAYRHAVGVQPSFDHIFGPKAGRLRILAFMRRDDFIDQASVSSLERDGYDVGAGIEHAWVPHAPTRTWMRTGFTYGRRITEAQRDASGYRGAYDGDRFQGYVEAGSTLPLEVRTKVGVSVSHARYAHRNLIDGAGLSGPSEASVRRDLSWSTSVGFSRPILDRYEIELAWSYRDRDSNVDPYQFHGHIVGAYFRAALF